MWTLEKRMEVVIHKNVVMKEITGTKTLKEMYYYFGLLPFEFPDGYRFYVTDKGWTLVIRTDENRHYLNVEVGRYKLDKQIKIKRYEIQHLGKMVRKFLLNISRITHNRNDGRKS